MEGENQNGVTVVIFGATGDLSCQKLLPSLLELREHGHMQGGLRIIGVSRDQMSDDDFRSRVRDCVECHLSEEFLGCMHYVSLDVTETGSYGALTERLKDLEKGEVCNRLFYLSVPPSLHAPIIQNIGTQNLAREEGEVWRRIVVEKPFGHNLETAQALDKELEAVFSEPQIFRTDHYLAKDAVQNIIAFRFSNVLFQNVWNKDFVESVHIRFYETKGVENRGAFYEQVGALRDVGQNHLLQILAIMAMKSPGSLDAQAISKRRLEVLNALEHCKPEQVSESAMRGQYVGYRDIPGVDPNSNVETFFAFEAHVNTPEWEGVPFIIEAGKAMPEDLIDIRVQFRAPMECVCGEDDPAHKHGNRLTFALRPQQQIVVRFWAKEPGLDFHLEPQNLGFTYAQNHQHQLDAYAKVLRSVLRGDRTVFPSAEEIESSWRFIMPILDAWGDSPFTFYERSTCPDVAARG